MERRKKPFWRLGSGRDGNGHGVRGIGVVEDGRQSINDIRVDTELTIFGSASNEEVNKIPAAGGGGGRGHDFEKGFHHATVTTSVV